MTNKYLIRVSLAMIAVSVLGLALFYSMRGGLPPAVGWNWPEEDERGGRRTPEQQLAVVVEYQERATATARFLAGPEASRKLETARHIRRSQPKTSEAFNSLASSSSSSGTSDLEFRAKYDTRSFFESARLHATTAIVLFFILLACGLLGLLRLKVRGMVAVGGGVLVLALLGGGALLLFTGASTLAGIMIGIMLISFFAQLVASNLLPGANHPFVMSAEDELRALPPDLRRRHIIKRLIGGTVLTLFGAVMTGLSMAIHAGVVVVATGAIAGGLFMMFTPMIAAIRMRVYAAR